MSLQTAYREDLHALVATLDDAGVLRPAEREAREGGINDATHMSELMFTNEDIVEALDEHEGFSNVVYEHSASATQAFI